MKVYENLITKKNKLAVVGLGYVGMPIAVAFAKKVNVIGFDIDAGKINQYQSGVDPTNEVGDILIKKTMVEFTADEKKLSDVIFYIVAVPTPVHPNQTPDLTSVERASEMIGRHLTKGTMVVYESTVYPGVTEEVCIPILEKVSGLTCGVDFKVGYSPERINPSDKIHRLEKIVKIVSSVDEESLAEMAKIYELIIEAGVYRASSIKVAEAAKVAENSQRDINIAFMNELAILFDPLDIDTNEVVEAMNTKWNALGFYPGLVGGHCIGIDPYYLIHKAKELGIDSQVIASGRKINEEMDDFVADMVIKKIISAKKQVAGAKVAILGLAFKEDCPDTRNSKVIDIIKKLKEYGVRLLVVDPIVDAKDVKKRYDIHLRDLDEINNIDCLMLAVAHQAFKNIKLEQIDRMFATNTPNNEKIILDVKGILEKAVVEEKGYDYWQL